jgi:hypothetical protein
VSTLNIHSQSILKVMVKTYAIREENRLARARKTYSGQVSTTSSIQHHVISNYAATEKDQKVHWCNVFFHVARYGDSDLQVILIVFAKSTKIIKHLRLAHWQDRFTRRDNRRHLYVKNF